ncbi:hypothetical protein Dimus_020278, partial [Dionaea muscipula]
AARLKVCESSAAAGSSSRAAGASGGGAAKIVPLLSEDVRGVGGVGVVGKDLGHIGAVEVDCGEDFGLGGAIGEGAGGAGGRGCPRRGRRQSGGRCGRGRDREGSGGDNEAE